MTGRPRLAWTCVAALCCLAAMVVTLRMGQDINWDQRNYHYYSVYALLRGRIAHDIAPAGIQSYLSPLPYIPFYLLVRHLPAVVAGLAMAAMQGLGLFAALVIAWQVAAGARFRRLLTLGATLISAASPLAVSELGGSFADVLTGVPVLAGLAVLLTAVGWPAGLLAGLLVGIGIGLKLTNAVFGLGLAAACLLGWPGWRTRIAGLVATGIGGLAGALLSGGAWLGFVWRRYGNPFFPNYNGVFRSPDYPAENFADNRFLPKGALDGLSYPLQWAQGLHPSAELVFRDIRFAAIMLLIPLALALPLVRPRPAPASPAAPRLLAFFAVAYVVWLFQFGIQRYAVVLEALTGPVVVVLLARLPFRPAAIVALGIAALVTMRVPDWERLRWASDWFGFAPPAGLAADGVYVLDTPPISYVVPALPPGGTYVAPTAGIDMAAGGATSFGRRLAAALARGTPAYVITLDRPAYQLRQLLGGYGLDLTTDCWPIVNRIRSVAICALARAPVSPLAVVTLADDRALSFGGAGAGLTVLTGPWWTPEGWGTWGDQSAAMFFRVAPALGPGSFIARMQVQAFVSDARPRATVTVTDGAGAATVWHFTRDDNLAARDVCIRPTSLDASRMVTLTMRDSDPASPKALGLGEDARVLTVGLRSLQLIKAPPGVCD